VPGKLEIGKPGHRGNRSQKERMRVVTEAWMPRIFRRAQSAAGDVRLLDAQRL
jgi:hypothetical protein